MIPRFRLLLTGRSDACAGGVTGGDLWTAGGSIDGPRSFTCRGDDDSRHKAEQGGVTEADWTRIDELLHQSWRSLHEAVNSPG